MHVRLPADFCTSTIVYSLAPGHFQDGVFLCSCVAVAPAVRSRIHGRFCSSLMAITPAWLMDYTLQLATPWTHLLPNPPSAADIKIQGLLALGRIKAAMALLVLYYASHSHRCTGAVLCQPLSSLYWFCIRISRTLSHTSLPSSSLH